jgi:hypothetical protein
MEIEVSLTKNSLNFSKTPFNINEVSEELTESQYESFIKENYFCPQIEKPLTKTELTKAENLVCDYYGNVSAKMRFIIPIDDNYYWGLNGIITKDENGKYNSVHFCQLERLMRPDGILDCQIICMIKDGKINGYVSMFDCNHNFNGYVENGKLSGYCSFHEESCYDGIYENGKLENSDFIYELPEIDFSKMSCTKKVAIFRNNLCYVNGYC